MIEKETERYTRHMEIYGISLPYNVVVYLNIAINRIGYMVEIAGISHESYLPWMA